MVGESLVSLKEFFGAADHLPYRPFREVGGIFKQLGYYFPAGLRIPLELRFDDRQDPVGPYQDNIRGTASSRPFNSYCEMGNRFVTDGLQRNQVRQFRDVALKDIFV